MFFYENLQSRETISFKLSSNNKFHFQFEWKPISVRDRSFINHPAEPMPSPTNVGGIFSIRKDFLEKLGYYDEQYEIWGAENLELSFKVRIFIQENEVSPTL
jgi:predicted glycosyltransferase involved in capsule biosynthesis